MKLSKKLIDEFPPVKTVVPFLGMDEGTVLKFDAASSKYVTVSQEEDIGEGEYYYSGYAIAIDPYIVKREQDIFEVLKLKSKPKAEKVELTVEEPPKDSDTKVDEVVPPKVEEANLTFKCGLCQTENLIHKIKYGLFFPVGEKTKLLLKCKNCGIETIVYYVKEDESKQEGK